MKLVVVESPAKAKTINKYLGKDYHVLASFGHVRDLPSKNGSVLPDQDFAMDYQISSDSSKHVKAIADSLKKCDTLYLATDPDREGEAISWHIVEALVKRRALKKDVKVERIVFYEITKNAVKEAINKPRQIDMDLVNSQQARRALDYLVGFNLSPILWRKLPGSRSAGRVQSVALRIICEREKEIEAFDPKEYWDISLNLQNLKNQDFTAKLTHVNNKKLAQFDLKTKEDTDKVLDNLNKLDYKVGKLVKKQSKRNPQPPFTTSSLQQEASRKLGFGAKQTMQVAQKLYEEGLITYMRTDGVNVSNEAVDATRKLIASSYGNEYVPSSKRFYKTKAKNTQEAHEAIRPTDVTKKPKELSSKLNIDQFRLYDLVWKRMISSQMESAILDQVAVDIVSKDNYATARANGSTLRFEGFLKVYKEGQDDSKDEDDQRLLPPLAENEDVGVKKIKSDQHFTQPPPRFSEASLVKRLEELGIGRPSTYAAIISVLQDRQYVRIDKKRFYAEDRGRIVTAFLSSFFEKYVEYNFTATLEDQLDHVSDGKMDWKDLLSQFWKDFNGNIESVSELTITDVIKELNQLLGDYLFPKDENGDIDRACPSCTEGKLSLKLGKFGAFLGCSNYPECKYTKQLGQEDSQGGEGLVNEPKSFGLDEETNLEITLRKGPYGFYLQLGEQDGDKKPKRVAIPKTMNALSMEEKDVKDLLSLPRRLGTHPDTGKVIVAGIGMYGPYIRHDGKYTGLKDDSVLEIGINRAVALIEEAPKGRKTAEPIKKLGNHPDTDKDISIFEGKYGPYVKYGRINASLPKDANVDDFDLKSALDLIAKKEGTKKKPKAKKK